MQVSKRHFRKGTFYMQTFSLDTLIISKKYNITELRTLIALKSRLDFNNRIKGFKQSDLADEINSSQPRISQALKKLEKDEIIYKDGVDYYFSDVYIKGSGDDNHNKKQKKIKGQRNKLMRSDSTTLTTAVQAENTEEISHQSKKAHETPQPKKTQSAPQERPICPYPKTEEECKSHEDCIAYVKFVLKRNAPNSAYHIAKKLGLPTLSFRKSELYWDSLKEANKTDDFVDKVITP